jgi:thioredoxin-like negative regulator of GroEL
MIAVLGACLASASPAEGLRRIQVGEVMPAFSLTDTTGRVFRYPHEPARVLGIIVVQGGQSNVGRIMADVQALVQELRSKSTAFDFLGVVSGPGGGESIQTLGLGSAASFPVVADPNFAFWGKLGVIAAPTAVVIGTDARVQWIRAGYGYDFIPGLHAQLKKALGLAGAAAASVQVEVLENASDRARRDRRIQLARTLARKGRLEAAIEELQKLYAADPNETDVAFELAQMQCRAGKNEAALATLAAAKTRTDQDRVRALWIGGWARRQMKQFDAAESLLTKALDVDPRSVRVLYELGKVCEAAGHPEKALAHYRRALAELFDETPSPDISRK